MKPDSFPVPTYLLFKGDEGLGRNDVIVKIAGYAGKEAFSGATGNESRMNL